MFTKPTEILSVWIRGVNDGNIDEVVSLYDPNAVLLPTFSNESVTDSNGIKSYFEQLAERNNLSVELHDKTVSVQTLSDNLYSMSGMYCWRFDVEGETLNFEARFTFVVDLNRASPIVHQHSSQIPRML